MWFPTQAGLVSVDPDAVGSVRVPEAMIESVQIGPDTILPDAFVSLQPGERDIRIVYGAAYFGLREELQFRYRLRPYDAEWRHAGQHEIATYTNLAPGSYTFEVAAGAGGSWQSDPATISFTRRPHYYETGWFYGLIGIAALLSGFLLHANRLRRLRRHRDRLEHEVMHATEALKKQNDTLEQQNVQLRKQEAQLGEQARKLLEMDQLKSQFFANASHELRTPLTLMLAPIQDLMDLRGDRLPKSVQHTLDLAYRNGLRLNRLINQILDISRFDEGGLVLKKQPVDMGEFLARQIAAYSSSADLKNLDLHFESDYEAVICAIDVDAMEKVVTNLISNAVKFTPRHGWIRVDLGITLEHQAHIQITDSGPGIPPEERERIFERFYQVDGTLTRNYEGFGIGLALSRELVEKHGGTISVTADAEGGARFTVLLPDARVPIGDEVEQLALPEVPSDPHDAAILRSEEGFDVVRNEFSEADRATAERVEATSGDSFGEADHRPLILVIEDNRDMLSYISTCLAEIGDVKLARDGQEGLDRAYEEIPDIIVSDVMMPGRDGYGLCVAIKEDRRTSHVPVLLLTARGDVESRIEGFGRGADAYLSKPFHRSELAARVRGLLENRRRLHQYFQQAPTLALPEADLSSRDADFLNEVRTAFEAHLNDTSFGVDQLADHVGWSRRQLSRKMRALTGESPAETFRRLRMERAAEMFMARSGSVKEVAHRMGYRSASSFRKAFKEYHGTSPSGYIPDLDGDSG